MNWKRGGDLSAVTTLAETSRRTAERRPPLLSPPLPSPPLPWLLLHLHCHSLTGQWRKILSLSESAKVNAEGDPVHQGSCPSGTQLMAHVTAMLDYVMKFHSLSHRPSDIHAASQNHTEPTCPFEISRR